MAKKIKIFSELVLGVASAFTLGFAINIKPVSACIGSEVTGYDQDGNPIVTNCFEPLDATTDSAEYSDAYSESGATVRSEKTISHSYFLAGNQVESVDRVNGLAAFAGNGVVFDGDSDYAALAGNSIIVNGIVRNDLFVAGNAVEITEGANIGRDIFGIANSFLIKTNLNGNVFVAGNRLVLENVTINGDLEVEFDEITIKGKSSVSGKFSYNDTAVVTGLENLSTGETVTYSGADKTSLSFASTVIDKILFMLGRLLVTIVFIAIATKFSQRLLDEFNLKSSWKYLGLGLGLIIIVPLAAIFVMVSVIGLPLGFIGFATYALFAYLSKSVTGGVIGNLLAERLFKQPKMHIMLKYTIGILLVELLSLIPYVGSLVGGVSVCFGFGYLAKKLFVKAQKAKK